MATVTALKCVRADFKSGFLAGPGPAEITPLSPLALTYTPGTTVTVDLVAERAFKQSIRDGIKRITPDSWLWDLDEYAGSYVFGNDLAFDAAKSHVMQARFARNYWAAGTIEARRIVEVQFNDATDLLGTIIAGPTGLVEYRVKRCDVIADVTP